jgi:tetratricopeptide (TPR) repeat protein
MKRLAWLLLLPPILLACAGAPRNAALAREYYNLGNAHLELKNFDRAASMYREAIRLDPKLQQAYFNLSLALSESGRAAEAVGILEGLLRKDPQNRELAGALAYAYHAAGQDEKAIAEYERIVEGSPQDTGALYNLAVLLGKAGRVEEAIPELKRLLEQNPQDLDALLLLGRMLAEAGRPEESAAALEQYVQERPEVAEAQALLGDDYRRLERYDRALDAYNAALALKANYAEPLFYSALIYLTRIEDPQAGLAALKQALDDGFADRARITQLYESPGLEEKDKVRQLLAERGLLPPPAESAP